MKTPLLAVGLLAVITACGGDDDDGASAATVAVTQDQNAGDAAPSGDPVKIMVVGQLEAETFEYPDMGVAAQAAAKKVNEDGGINGRPVEIILCNDAGDTNKTSLCGRQAVDEEVVAVTGFTLNGSVLVPIFEAAKVPYINSPLAPAEYGSDVSFVLDTPASVQYAAAAVRAVENGCQKVGVSFIGGQASSEIVANAVVYGVESAGAVALKSGFDPNAADLTPHVEALVSDGAACLIPIMSPSILPRYLDARANASPGIPLAGTNDVVPESVRTDFAEQLNGMITVSPLPPFDGPELEPIVSEIHAIDSSVFIETKGMTPYFAVFLVRQALEGAGDVSGEAVLEGLRQLDQADAGVFGTLDFTQPGPFANLPRIFNSALYVSTLEGGKSANLEGPIDFGEQLAGVKAQL